MTKKRNMTKGLLYKGESLWYNKPAIRVEVLFREKGAVNSPFARRRVLCLSTLKRRTFFRFFKSCEKSLKKV